MWSSCSILTLNYRLRKPPRPITANPLNPAKSINWRHSLSEGTHPYRSPLHRTSYCTNEHTVTSRSQALPYSQKSTFRNLSSSALVWNVSSSLKYYSQKLELEQLRPAPSCCSGLESNHEQCLNRHPRQRRGASRQPQSKRR